jgi:hypothetical protein
MLDLYLVFWKGDRSSLLLMSDGGSLVFVGRLRPWAPANIVSSPGSVRLGPAGDLIIGGSGRRCEQVKDRDRDLGRVCSACDMRSHSRSALFTRPWQLILTAATERRK